jgi:protein required for attachment to host cells
MLVRIVVADQSEARFYDVERFNDPLRLSGQLTDEKAHLHNRDLVSDRPGRVFDHAPTPGGRRGATAHHATGGERTPRKHEALNFARQIGAELESARRDGVFDRLVIMAPPQFLGLLRETLPRSVQDVITAQIHKDLVHSAQEDVRAHVPDEAFR